jgi:putative transcriptional regulator
MKRKQPLTAVDRSLIRAAKEALAYARGEPNEVRVTRVWVADVKAIRRDLSMSQQEFARAYGIPLRTVQSWEQGVRQPDATARAYLRTIARLPKQVKSALAG